GGCWRRSACPTAASSRSISPGTPQRGNRAPRPEPPGHRADRPPRRPRATPLWCGASLGGAMCTDESPASQFPAVLHDFEPAVQIALEPVDSVVLTTLMDNVTDTTMPAQGPARRLGWHSVPRRSSAVMEDGRVPDALLAEHGFSVLVTVAKAGREHRFLFD